MRLKTELYDILSDAIGYGINSEEKLTYAVQDLLECVLMPLIKFCKKHEFIALSCGSEWLYQDDEAQADALELLGTILDKLSGYAEDIENE